VNSNTSTFVQSQVENVKPQMATTILTSDSPPGLSDVFGRAGAASDFQILKGFQGRSPWLGLAFQLVDTVSQLRYARVTMRKQRVDVLRPGDEARHLAGSPVEDS